ncbi:hypothetical protein EJ063_15220 [Vibrio aquaticus]|uniref:O-antigen ligase domain-containing protein n=1 Tax=Vibrio aquaticus TaxID=2496559 RepID=A0A3S0MIG4_9VIBR|nr:hypothetical protein [Vibrio aquaticus]RTZ14661.1 hypothetical protein EJ063_15220 [Vibrio aquaticus]
MPNPSKEYLVAINLFRLVSLTVGLSLVLSAVLIFFRLVTPVFGIDQYSFSQLIIIFNLIILAVSGFSISIIWLDKGKIPFSFIIFSLVLFVYFYYGFILNGINYFSFQHIYYFLAAYVFFEFGRNLLDYISFSRLQGLFKLGFFSNFFVVVCYKIMSVFYVIYPGYGGSFIGYIAIYFLSLRNRIYFFVSVILIVAQGKRSILLSFIASLVVYYAFFKVKLGFFFTFSLMISFVTALLLGIEYLDLYSIGGLGRLAYINPFSDRFDLYLGSSGRFDEILSMFRGFSSYGLEYLFGRGFGFSYEWELSYRPDFIEIKGYVHNTHLLIFALTGLVGLSIWLGYFIFVFSSIRRRMNGFPPHEQRIVQFFCMSLIFFFISGFFSLNIISDIFGVICVGVVHYLSIYCNRKGREAT